VPPQGLAGECAADGELHGPEGGLIEDAQQGGFTGPVLPHHGHQLPGPDLQVCPFEHLMPPVSLVQVPGLRAQPAQPVDVAALQAFLDTFTSVHNH
jgi:hypothetical protein